MTKARTNKNLKARNNQYFNFDIADNRSSKPNRTKSSFDSANEYYKILYNTNNTLLQTGMENCFAVKLSKFIISILKEEKNTFKLTRENCFREDFYSSCLESISMTGISSEINDEELLVIYMKQIVSILKTSGIIINQKGKAAIRKTEISDTELFYKIFHSFWVLVDWKNIFPSDPEAAAELKRSRGILTDILLKHSTKTNIEEIANEFFELTDFSRKNNMFMISFLDFYFFTWLKHFGILKFYNGKNHTSVQLMVTDRGRAFLNSIIQ